MKTPRVSVVIATYNRSKMVCEAVLSAWNQSLKPYEIVVSDDCSTDSTIVSLEKLKDTVPVLKVVKTLKNTGGVPNWNHVINSSCGDLIAWCSDDDKFEYAHLETAVSYLRNNPDVALVHSSFINISEFEDGVQLVEKSPLKSSHPIKVSRENLLLYSSKNFNWPFHPSTLIFRRSVWSDVGEFNARFEIADTDWFIRCARTFILVYLPYYGVSNRRHFGSAGNWSNRVGSAKMQRELRESIFEFYNSQAESPNSDIDLRAQMSKWLRSYRLLLLRIFIARCRAGALPVAKEVAHELFCISDFLSYLPKPFRSLTILSAFYFLNSLQVILPGGRAKYQNLGKHVPL